MAQGPSTEKLKADRKKVVQTINSDSAETEPTSDRVSDTWVQGYGRHNKDCLEWTRERPYLEVRDRRAGVQNLTGNPVKHSGIATARNANVGKLVASLAPIGRPGVGCDMVRWLPSRVSFCRGLCARRALTSTPASQRKCTPCSHQTIESRRMPSERPSSDSTSQNRRYRLASPRGHRGWRNRAILPRG